MTFHYRRRSTVRCHDAAMPGMLAKRGWLGGQRVLVATLALLAASSAGGDQPSWGEVVHVAEALPISGPVRASEQYIDNSIVSVGYSISIKGGPFWLYPKRGDPFLMPRSELQCESDPLSPGVTSIELVYRSRPAALRALTGTPMKLAYYAGERGIVYPTILSSTTTPRLCEATRKARELQLKDVEALRTLGGRMLLVISLATLQSTLSQEPVAVATHGAESANAAALARQVLVAELRSTGVSFTESAIQGITRTVSGRLVWLETGGSSAGLMHIMARHGVQFAQWGLRSAQQVSDFLIRIVGSQAPAAATGDAFDFAVTIGGVEKMLRIVIGSNGFIVTAHPL